MIPAVFGAIGARAGAAPGCIGIAGAVGALGEFLVPRGFAISTTATGSLVPALLVFGGVYAVLATVTFTVCARGRGCGGCADTVAGPCGWLAGARPAPNAPVPEAV